MKICPNCKVEKSLNDYWKGQSSCIECMKWKQKNYWNSRTPKKRLEQHLKCKYGVTHAEFIKSWEEQEGKCAICKEVLPDLMAYENRRRGYAIDHNHSTGEFRGILCNRCNSLLGMAKERAEVLDQAAHYLRTRGHYAEALIFIEEV